ncbi:MAG: hypothetical protein ACREBZ_03730 [Thermoplasmata archaeon]
MTRTSSSAGAGGLADLRRSGAVTELLFLYTCATLEPTQLRPVADALHLTVQAVSHSYRQLRRRGLVEMRAGRYRPSVAGVEWLHGSLGRISEDTAERLVHLHVIRSTRALAGDDLADGAAVSLELRDGLLTAVAGGRGASHGRARGSVARGKLVEVSDLEGIVPVEPAPVTIRTISDRELSDPALSRNVHRALSSVRGLVAAMGIEAFAVLSDAGISPVERFAVAEVGREAARIGVPVTIVAVERELPRLLSEFAKGDPPTLHVGPLLSELRTTIGRRSKRPRGSGLA